MTADTPAEPNRPAVPNKPGGSGAPVSPDAVFATSDEPDPNDLGANDLGGLGGIDIGSLFAAATEMQQQMAEAHDAAAQTEVEGVAGGGAVRITVTGAGDFLAVEIQPSAVDPSDVEMLQDLVLAALHDATRQVQQLQEESMGGGLGGLGDLLGGGGLGGGALGELFGGPAGPEH